MRAIAVLLFLALPASAAAAPPPADEPVHLTVDDGWRIYQAVCAPTLNRELTRRVTTLKRQLRAGRMETVRSGVLSLAADLSRDPQFRECRALTTRVDHLLIHEIPALLRNASARHDTVVTAAR